jgi:hypothetical protein
MMKSIGHFMGQRAAYLIGLPGHLHGKDPGAGHGGAKGTPDDLRHTLAVKQQSHAKHFACEDC